MINRKLARKLAGGLLGWLAIGGALATPARCYTGSTVQNATVLPPSPLAQQSSTDDLELLNLKSPTNKLAALPALDNRGLIDGVYECDATLNGATERILISFNGKANGATLYTVAAIKTYYQLTSQAAPIPVPPLRGWGLGTITATGYAGTTWDNQPFSFKLLGLEEYRSKGTYDVLRLSGSVGIAGGQTAKLTCKTDRALF